MPTTIKTIRPFYDSDSDCVTAALPPFSPLITDQLELFGSGHRLGTLLADEALSPVASLDSGTSVKPRSRRSTPAPEFRIAIHPPKASRSAQKSSRQKSPSPYQKKVGFQRASSSTPECEATTSPESSEGGSEDSSTESIASEDKIPKPPGEPGRPGRGGYTLETALDWNGKTYAKFKKCMHRLIEEHLDTTKCASAQNPTLLKVVCEKATDAFPDLENYSDCWPATDMIMMRLKYTSSRARRQEIEMAAGKGTGKGKKTRSANV
ncbi:hypothetical protein BKA83DRAFT_4499840 [Pisolithus microcarpus]|nr:hypothetical protein BKA83DRAFT_4499840 [Pisolithus microcarpus]